MRRFVLFTCLCLGLTAQGAVKKDGKKDAKKAEPVVKVVTPTAAPVAALGDRAPIWHSWTDKDGQKVDAQFCGLSGDFITIQTRDGRTYHFKTDILIPEDVEFARSCLDRNRKNSFSPAIIASAAADIDRLVGTVLAANKQSLNAPATDEQFLRRIYLDAAGRVPTAKEASAFLSSSAPDKRAKLIDELVFSPSYSMQMFNWMADLLRVKDTFAKGVPAFTFEDWLKTRLAAKKMEQRTVARAWCERAGTLLLHRAPADARRFANIHELPTLEQVGLALTAASRGPLLATKRRGITRFQITESIYATTAPPEKLTPALIWVPLTESDSITLSGPHRRWIAAILAGRT